MSPRRYVLSNPNPTRSSLGEAKSWLVKLKVRWVTLRHACRDDLGTGGSRLCGAGRAQAHRPPNPEVPIRKTVYTAARVSQALVENSNVSALRLWASTAR